VNNVVWLSLIPHGASVLGWGLAMIGQAVQAGRVNRREHYYKVLERAEDICQENDRWNDRQKQKSIWASRSCVLATYGRDSY
jgi:hypothetical protein